ANLEPWQVAFVVAGLLGMLPLLRTLLVRELARHALSHMPAAETYSLKQIAQFLWRSRLWWNILARRRSLCLSGLVAGVLFPSLRCAHQPDRTGTRWPGSGDGLPRYTVRTGTRPLAASPWVSGVRCSSLRKIYPVFTIEKDHYQALTAVLFAPAKTCVLDSPRSSGIWSRDAKWQKQYYY